MDRRRTANLAAAIAAVTVFGFTMGLMFPLLALIMESRGVAPDIIGYNTAMQPLGILIAGFVTPRLVKAHGAKRVIIATAYAAAAIILAYPFLPDFLWWFPLRVIHGMAISTLFSVSEAWIVKFSEGPWRSRILALYSSMLAASFGAGPLLISWAGIEGLFPFAAGAAGLIAATLPMYFVHDREAEHTGEEAPLTALAFMPKAPILMTAILAFAIIDAANLGFLPVYGIKKGMDQESAALALSVFVFGNVVLQLPIGWLADHMPKRRVMAGCAFATAIASALIPLAFGTFLFWLLLLIAGAASAGIYTVALAELGERFSGAELIAGAAAISTMWGLGALLGAVIAGWAFGFGPDGLPYAMALIFALITLPMVMNQSRSRS